MHFCKNCNIRFDKLTTYINHRRKEHARFPCPDCGKVFGIRKKLAYHLRGCAKTRRNKIRHESGSIISCSNYKNLPIVTAKELDSEFEIYMDRKFGRKGIFRNEKMCKFCCKTFVMASDFADHIRDHYKSIPLDVTSVKSKFDFMHFMGLKIRETKDTDCSDAEIPLNKLKNQMAECKVVIIGERCKICCKAFKCRTDLDQHNKIYHSLNNRNKIIVVLRIGKEIISRIPVKKRHIRSRIKAGCQSNCNELRMRSNEVYTSKRTSNAKENDKETDIENVQPVRESTLNNKTNDVSQGFEVIEERRNVQSAMLLEKERRRAVRLQNEINQTGRNMTLCSQEARGRKRIVEQEELITADEARNGFRSDESSYETKVGGFELESRRIYADEFFDSMQFSEPWKDEVTESNASWYSQMKLEENDLASDDEASCYCNGMIGPRLTPKERNAWELEHYNNILNEEESGSCHEMSFHESPPIYKYSCDSKYQAAFSFPSDEKSFEFQVKHEDNEETNNNEKDSNYNVNKSCALGYEGAITVKDQRTNLTVNHSRSAAYQCEDKSYAFQGLETGKVTIVNKKYQEVLIKEEVMLEDCTCCINDVYPSLSHSLVHKVEETYH